MDKLVEYLCIIQARTSSSRLPAKIMLDLAGKILLERVYEVCLCHELEKRNLRYERQVNIPIVYDGISFEEGYRIDILVEDQIIIELKAVENYNPVWKAQVLSYLKVTGKRLGLLINFNVPLLKDGVQRVIL